MRTPASFSFVLAASLTCTLATSAAHAQQLVTRSPTATTGWRTTTLAEGIAHPWAMAWLPSGEILITSREGTLHKFANGRLSRVPTGPLPDLLVAGQGGLLDISIRPGVAPNADKPRIYMTMAAGSSNANRTTLVRGTYDGERLEKIEALFRVRHDKSGGEHFGSRLVWLPDGTLLMSIGDGGNPPRTVSGMLAREQAQSLGRHHGKIIRLDANGAAPADNPFVGNATALPEIWSYGHRNIQGMVRDPETGRIWATEHGPRGGDELNVVKRGLNYGWPLASYGHDYMTNEPIGQLHINGATDALVVWKPSTAPSGLAVYRGDRFPAWRGDLFSGNLVSKDIHRIRLGADSAVLGLERIPIGARVRDVRLGPDGYLYVLTDERNGRLIRIEPSQG
jgi:glucose/arabinose dehydrogenase